MKKKIITGLVSIPLLILGGFFIGIGFRLSLSVYSGDPMPVEIKTGWRDSIPVFITNTVDIEGKVDVDNIWSDVEVYGKVEVYGQVDAY